MTTATTEFGGVPQMPGEGLRILVVEDHGDTRRTLSRLLSYFGHKISVADSRQSAMKMIAAKKFDVLLTDIALPDGSGYEVASQAKEKQHVKSVALTGFDRAEDIRRGKDAGFDFYLTKPIDFAELRSVLGQIAA
jgi:CheY-like chemotaxis protein